MSSSSTCSEPRVRRARRAVATTPARALRGTALITLLAGGAVWAASCGGGGIRSSAALKLEREDFAAVARALERSESSVAPEVAATESAWPLIVNGLPADADASDRATIARAALSAARITEPVLFEEAQAASLTGPGSGLAGMFRSYLALATHGWKLIVATIEEIEHGSPATAQFARENVALYIESIYDGHFTLSQVGKRLLAGYDKLGGPAGFAASLSQPSVDRLAAFYSEASDRLHPHDGVRLGS